MRFKKGDYYILYNEEIVLILNTKHFLLQGQGNKTLRPCIATKIIKEAFKNPNANRRAGMVGGTSVRLFKDKKTGKKIPRLKVELIK